MIMMKHLLFILFSILSLSTNAQVGIGTENPRATLDVVATNKTGTVTNVEGILIPRVSRQRAQSMQNVEKSTLVFIDDVSSGTSDTGIASEGFYYFTGTRWQNVSETSIAAPPKFFYMPSVVLPTATTDTRIVDVTNTDYTYVGGEYIVNLYNLYRNQFTTPVISSIVDASNPSLPAGTVVTANDTLESLVKPATSYHYFVTYADPNVFEEIKLDANGILKYKVKSNSIIRTGTFMNIVIKNK